MTNEHTQNHSLLLVWRETKAGTGRKVHQKLEKVLPGL
jgi:hypothetical protein